jgi:hypothetical protein
MEMCLLLLRAVDILNDEHQKVLPEFEIVDPLQYLLIIEPAILDILPDLGKSPPFPVELLA